MSVHRVSPGSSDFWSKAEHGTFVHMLPHCAEAADPRHESLFHYIFRCLHLVSLIMSLVGSQFGRNGIPVLLVFLRLECNRSGKTLHCLLPVERRETMQ